MPHSRLKGSGCYTLLALALANSLACDKKVNINRWVSLKCGSHLPHAVPSDRLMIRGIEAERGSMIVYSAGSCILSRHLFGNSNLYCEDGTKMTIDDKECVWTGVSPRGSFVCGARHASEDGTIAVIQEWSVHGVFLGRRTAALPKPNEKCDFLVPDGFSSNSELVYQASCPGGLLGVVLFDGKRLQWDRLGVQRSEAQERARELVVTHLGNGVHCK